MNWSDIVVIVIIVSSMYFGYKKGFIVAGIELIKWLAAIVLARIFHVHFTAFVTEHFWNPTERVSKHVNDYLYDFFKYDPITAESLTGAQMTEALEKLPMPDYFQEVILEKIQNDMIGQTIEFIEMVSVHLTEMIVNGMGFLLLVVLLLIGFGFVQFFGNALAKLPLFKELNQGGGVIIGAMMGVVSIYFIIAVLEFFPTFQWSYNTLEAIENSQYAIYFYKYNVLKYVFKTVVVQGNLLF